MNRQDGQLKKHADYVRANFRTRPLWGLLALVHSILDNITLAAWPYLIAKRVSPRRGFTFWAFWSDAYIVLVLVVSSVVLFTGFLGGSGIQGTLAIYRLVEIVVLWVGVICRQWWKSDWSVYGTFVHGYQVVVLLAIIMRSFTPNGFVNTAPHPHQAMGTAASKLLYVAFTNMTTRGNQYVPETGSAEALTVLASVLGLLLFGSVLAAVLPSVKSPPPGASDVPSTTALPQGG